MQGGATERSCPVRQSFAELLSAKLVKLETDFGLEPKFGLHVIAGQVAISLKSARAALGRATADDAPPNVRQGAVPPRLQEAEAMRLQRAFGIDREYALGYSASGPLAVAHHRWGAKCARARTADCQSTTTVSRSKMPSRRSPESPDDPRALTSF